MQCSFCVSGMCRAIWRRNTNNSSLGSINVGVSIHPPTLQIITRKKVAFILHEREYKFKTGGLTCFFFKENYWIHTFLRTSKLDGVTFKLVKMQTLACFYNQFFKELCAGLWNVKIVIQMNINAQCGERRGNWPWTSRSVQSSCLAGKTNFSPFFVRNRWHSTIGWILCLVEVKSVSAWKIHDPEKVIFNEYLWAMSFLIRAVQVFWSLPQRLACDFLQKPVNQNEGNGLDTLTSDSFWLLL